MGTRDYPKPGDVWSCEVRGDGATGVVMATSWGATRLTSEEALALLQEATGELVDGEEMTWHSVLADQQDELGLMDWHSDGRGQRSVVVMVEAL